MREGVQMGEAEERERESSGRLPTEEGRWGGNPTLTLFQDPEIMTWPEIESPMLNWLSQPGAPPDALF